MKELHFNKGEIIQRKGDTNHKIYHVQKGLLRSYCIDRNGKEHVYLFAPEAWILADSVGPEKPAELYIDALEDSSVLVSEKDNQINEGDYKKFYNRFEALQMRIMMLLSTSAIERYEHFVNTYPDIVQRVPQKLIASYLGVNPETLSAAKRKWKENSNKDKPYL